MKQSIKLNYKIRIARSSDAQQIAKLCLQLGYSNTSQEIENRLNAIDPDRTQSIWVAVSNKNDIVGWVHALKVVYLESNPFIEIGGLVVDQDQRGKGIGKALIQKVEHWAKTIGLLEIRLRSNIIRKEAHQFYEKIGFKNVKTQYTFYKKLD
jgi:GNAT superfamily N-acetyltransferase